MNNTSLIFRVLSGEASEREKAELTAWISQRESHAREYQDIKLLWEHANEGHRATGDDHFYDGLAQIKATHQRHHRTRPSYAAIFLILIISLALSLLLYQTITSQVSSRASLYLQFDGEAIERVIPVLEKHYHIRIEVKNPRVLACRFTGIFYAAESVEDVMEALTLALGLTISVSGDGQYYLDGDGCGGIGSRQ